MRPTAEVLSTAPPSTQSTQLLPQVRGPESSLRSHLHCCCRRSGSGRAPSASRLVPAPAVAARHDLVATNIRVTTISPGAVKTEFRQVSSLLCGACFGWSFLVQPRIINHAASQKRCPASPAAAWCGSRAMRAKQTRCTRASTPWWLQVSCDRLGRLLCTNRRGSLWLPVTGRPAGAPGPMSLCIPTLVPFLPPHCELQISPTMCFTLLHGQPTSRWRRSWCWQPTSAQPRASQGF